MQQPQKQVLSADVTVFEPLGFLCSICEYTFAILAEREIHRGGEFLARRGVPLDLFADGLHGNGRAKETVSQGLILAQQPEQ